jgi:hypothetical protein
MKINLKFIPFSFITYKVWKSVFLLIFVCNTVYAQNSNKHFNSPESLVSHLYDQVTFSAGESPNWDYVKTLFTKDATVVMRMSKTESVQLSLDGWVQDFVNFINKSNIKSTGFEEKIIKSQSMVFGNIAHVLVLYTSNIPGKTKTPREGVDSFHLAKKDGRWWIVSILNEIPTSNRLKPDVLKTQKKD